MSTSIKYILQTPTLHGSGGRSVGCVGLGWRAWRRGGTRTRGFRGRRLRWRLRNIRYFGYKSVVCCGGVRDWAEWLRDCLS